MSVVGRLWSANLSSRSPSLICRLLSSTAVETTSKVSSADVGIPDKLFKQINIELKGHDKAVLKSYTTVLKAAATNLEIPTGDITLNPKPSLKRYTLLRSAHIYKKHRVQYEMRTYHAHLDLFRLTGSTAETYLEYVERMLPEGVGMKVTRTEIDGLPDYMKSSD